MHPVFTLLPFLISGPLSMDCISICLPLHLLGPHSTIPLASALFFCVTALSCVCQSDSVPVSSCAPVQLLYLSCDRSFLQVGTDYILMVTIAMWRIAKCAPLAAPVDCPSVSDGCIVCSLGASFASVSPPSTPT